MKHPSACLSDPLFCGKREWLFENLDNDKSLLHTRSGPLRRTLMHDAAMLGDEESVRKLLVVNRFYENTDDDILYDDDGWTPLCYVNKH